MIHITLFSPLDSMAGLIVAWGSSMARMSPRSFAAKIDSGSAVDFSFPPGPFAKHSCHKLPGSWYAAIRCRKMGQTGNVWKDGFSRDLSVDYYKTINHLDVFCCFSVCCFCQARISEAAQWSLCDRVQCQQLLWRWRVRIPSAKRCCVFQWNLPQLGGGLNIF